MCITNVSGNNKMIIEVYYNFQVTIFSHFIALITRIKYISMLDTLYRAGTSVLQNEKKWCVLRIFISQF